MLVETLVYEGAAPRAWGRMHGETWRARIEALYRIRLELTLERTDLQTERNVLALAERHLPVLERFDAALCEELLGIAEGANLSAAQLVVLNHYTDLRDLSRKDLEAPATDGDAGCSVICAPTDQGPVLAQTWDMHGSATDHVVMLQVPLPAGGHALLFSITGCLGMCGLTSSGLGMTINNLNSLDAGVGVVWPALVRRCLRADSSSAARDVVMHAELGSGHHYLVADPTEMFGIETSGTQKKVTQTGLEQIHLHTNHCVDDEMKPTATINPGSTTYERLASLEELCAATPPKTPLAAWRALETVKMARDESQGPHNVASCGAMLMELSSRKAWVCTGAPDYDEHRPMVIEVRP